MKNKFIIKLTYILIFFNTNLFSNEKNILKVGLLAPLSGEYKELGNSLLYSLQLALNEIDDKNVQIIPRDSGSNDKKKIFNRLMSTNDHPCELIDRLLTEFATPNIGGENEVIDGVSDFGSNTLKQNFTLTDIASVVSRYFGLECIDLTGRSRRCGIVLARQVFMFLAHRIYGYTKHCVADYLNRDPSTISYGCGVIEKRNTPDSEIARYLSVIQRVLQKEFMGSL